MNSNIWVITLGDSITIATTLILAALGALLSERSGVLNLGAEGMLMVGAVTGALAADGMGNIWLGLLAGTLAGTAMGLAHGFLCVSMRANQIVTGLAMVIFGTGLANFVGKPVEGVTLKDQKITTMNLGPLQDIPLFGKILFDHDPITFLTIGFTVAVSWYIFHTRPGLTLRALGDDPATVDAQGLSVSKLRLMYVTFGGALIGLSGAWLLFAQTNTWQQGTTGGKGWIALALVVFAGWRPIRVIFGAVLFGFALQVPFTLQAEQITVIPTAFLDMVPYVVTLITLVAMSTPKAQQAFGAPKSLGLPFVRDER